MSLRFLQSSIWRKSASVNRTHPWLPVIFVFAIGAATTAVLFAAILRWEQRDNQAEFEYEAMHPIVAIRRAAERIELAHEAIQQNFYGSKDDVSAEEFVVCAEPFLSRVPSLKVVQWAPLVLEKERRQFEQRDYSPLFHISDNQIISNVVSRITIVELDAQGNLAPAQPRTEHFPILYAATKRGFRARFGWDFAADPVLLRAIDSCRDSGEFVVSEMISLANIGLSDRVVQTFLPIYKNPQTTWTDADRRENLSGLLVGLCQLDDLVNYAIGYSSGHRGIDLALIDETSPSHPQVLYFHPSRTRSADERSKLTFPNVELEGIYYADQISFGGRTWKILCTPAPGFFSIHESWRSPTVLFVGLLLTLLATACSYSAVTRRRRIELIVDQRTAELHARDRQLREAHEETIQRLSAASLCRDEETGMHIRRTGLLSEALARAAGWSEADVETIRLAAPMHDVGKIGIPDAILQKPGKLTPEEFEVMKMHTTLGALMLDGSQSPMINMAHDIALCHHERWDGKGYPRGLRGEQIPEAARILSIADVYDALSNRRVYRPAFPEQKVLTIMREGSGTQFDPRLLQLFLDRLPLMRRILHENPDEPPSEQPRAILSPRLPAGLPVEWPSMPTDGMQAV